MKLRISNSKLRIEEGRYTNIPKEDRICPLCNINIEDELHFVIVCNKLCPLRHKLFENIYEIIPTFINIYMYLFLQFFVEQNNTNEPACTSDHN